MPRADTGSAFFNGLSDFFTLLLHLERRLDPWFRPAFDAFLRDPIARFTTDLINRKRPNEGLRIAEEKLLPDEEAFLDSIITTFEQQMRKLWKPGGMERGGNTKTHGIVRGEFIIHDDLPANFAVVSMRSRGSFPPGSASPVPVPTSPPTSMMSAS